jgi:DNA-binding response OmpR family regulator
MWGAIFDKLSRDGYDLLQVEDEAHGLETTLKEKSDLIMLDLLLPIMDGMDVLHKIRSDETWGKKVPIVYASEILSRRDCSPAVI